MGSYPTIWGIIPNIVKAISPMYWKQPRRIRGTMSDDLKDRLRAMMEKRGMTARSLSLASGLASTAVRDILSGRSATPRPSTILRLAKVLQCPVEELAGKDIFKEVEYLFDHLPERMQEGKGRNVSAMAIGTGDDIDGPDYSDAPAVNFTNANLSNANLSDGDFRKSIFAGADLSGAKLTRAKLAGCVFTGANLAGADLEGSDLRAAVLIDVDLEGTILVGANLGGAVLMGTDLGRAVLVRPPKNVG